MADNTRSKLMDELIKKNAKDIEELIKFKDVMLTFKGQMDDSNAETRDSLTSIHQQMRMVLSYIQNKESPSGSGSSTGDNGGPGILGAKPGNPRYESTFRFPKIDFPYFNGDKSREWVRKCERYFQLHAIKEEQKLSLAELHLQDKADLWFDSWKLSHTEITWELFKLEVCKRLTNQLLENAINEFHKLVQTTTVDEYQGKFEELKALVAQVYPNLPEAYYVASSVGGLKDELKALVKVHKPQSLSQALELARAQEISTSAVMVKAKVSSKTTFPAQHTSRFSPFPSKTTEIAAEKLKGIDKIPTHKVITPAELQEKRAKGLCFRCHEKFFHGHQCKQKQLHFILADEDAIYGEVATETENKEVQVCDNVPSEVSQLSFHALSGQLSANTIRIQGLLKKKSINILIDSGSTHTFLDTKLAKDLNCIVEPTNPIQVTVADGNKLISELKCPNLSWLMQEQRFQHDVRLLKLGGCDMVLGVDWMRIYSPMLFDFNKMELSFQKEGSQVTLKGYTEEAQLKSISCKALKKSLRSKSCTIMGCLFSLQAEDPPSPTVPMELQPILGEFEAVFAPPKGLPLVREWEHHIVLKLGSSN